MPQTIEERRAKKRAYMRAFRSAHPDRARQQQEAWHAAHPDYNRNRVKQWRDANPEKSREGARASYYRNWAVRASARGLRADELSRRREAWRRANLEKDAAKSRRRHARVRGAAGTHTLEQFLAVCIAHEWRCAYCRCNLTRQTVTEDHAQPVSRGGSDYIENIVPACRRCNSQKKAMTGAEYRAHRSVLQ